MNIPDAGAVESRCFTVAEEIKAYKSIFTEKHMYIEWGLKTQMQ